MIQQAHPSLFAVIIHYNNWPDVLDTISDAVQAGVSENRIALIDNGSPLEAQSVALNAYPALRWIAGHGNIGYGAALNLGAKIAAAEGAEILLAVTHEVRLEHDALANMLNLLEASPRAAAVGPRLRRKSDRTMIWSEGGRFNRLTCLASPVSQWSSSSVDWIDGCCFVVRLSEFEAVGGVYEPYFLYMEEVDLFQRLRAEGHEVLVSENA